MSDQVKTVDVWLDSRGAGTCRGCGRPMIWYTTFVNGKKLPFDPPAVPLRSFTDEGTHKVVEVLDLATTHWATCPDRERFKKGEARR